MPIHNRTERRDRRPDFSSSVPPGSTTDAISSRIFPKPPDGFAARKSAIIPAWAKVVALVANSIDGWPPVSDGIYSIEEFPKVAAEVQGRSGAGEWDVMVYAMDDPNAALEVYPYGRDNPYRRLRGARGHRVKQIARFSYMHWDWYDFAVESAT